MEGHDGEYVDGQAGHAGDEDSSGQVPHLEPDTAGESKEVLHRRSFLSRDLAV